MMFHRSVVFKKSDIIYSGFYPENETELIVHFYGDSPHMVFDPFAFNPDASGDQTRAACTFFTISAKLVGSS